MAEIPKFEIPKFVVPDMMDVHGTISRVAYEKWEKAGCPSGDGLEFWLEAEKELTVFNIGTAKCENESAPKEKCCKNGKCKEAVVVNPYLPHLEIRGENLTWMEKIRRFWARLNP